MGKVLVRNRQKALLKSETRDMGGNTPHGNTGQTGIGEGLSSQGDRGKKGTWSLGYKQEMVTSTFNARSLIGLNFLGRNLAIAIKNSNDILPDPEILFLGNYSIDILARVCKDIHTHKQ